MNSSVLGPPTHILSHILSSDTPAYGDGDGFVEEPASSIAAGGSANSSVWRFPNHLGTHLDASRHFFDSGETVDKISVDRWWFSHPQLLDLDVADDELIRPAHLGGRGSPDTDLLLLRTGYEAHRGSDRYWQRNPGLSEELGQWIREAWPAVRAIGMDMISVTARAHRPEGRLAHRALLDPTGPGSPVLLIEDMALGNSPLNLRAVLVSPLRVRASDGGPCTVFAWT